jgi:peptidoglycan/LPS O-acetylase OafA/YrhL
LLSDPHIRGAAVVGRPHHLLGEECVAYVVTDPGYTGSSPDRLAGQLLDRCRRALSPHKQPASVILAALGAEAVYFLAETGVTTALGSGNDPFQPSVIPFNVGAIACLYLVGVALVKPGRSRRLRAAVRSGSDNSYGIYLAQMLFISALIWLGWAKLDSVVWWPLLCAGTVVIVYLGCVALTSLLARTPLAVPLTGRLQQPWATLVPGRAAPRPATPRPAAGRDLPQPASRS